MSHTLHAIPAATVTHTTAVIHGEVTSDIAVYHARTTDARISLTFGSTLMSLYSADATQVCWRPSRRPATRWRASRA